MIRINSITLVIACITHLYVINASSSVKHAKLEFPDKELIFSEESLEDGKLTLALCAKNMETKERQCSVVREKSRDSDETKSCNFTIKIDERAKERNMDQDEIKIFPLEENEAVLYVIVESQNGFVQFNTVNLDSRDGFTQATSLSDPSFQKNDMIIIPYKKTFDVYFYNHKVGEKYHIMKFGSDGTMEQRPLAPTKAETFSPNVKRIVSISGSPDKGLVYMERTTDNEKDREFEFKLRKTDGSDISLGKQVVHEPLFLSTNDDLIGMCFRIQNTEPKFNCTQHNLNGEEKFNINPLKDDDKTSVAGVRNFPEGGMLIVVGSCEADICGFYELDFSIIKVDSTGQTVGTAKIGKVEAVSNTGYVEMAVTYHTDKDNNNCISIANFEGVETGRHDRGLLGGSTYCLGDADFTK